MARWILAIWLILISGSTVAAAVLEYHHVSDSGPQSTRISREHFKRQMDYLAHNNFHIVPLPVLANMLREGKSLPDKTVAITFDDSYASVYHSAYPLLRQRGWPFTFFVNTAAVNSAPALVSWAQLREMASNGVTIANHSQHHRHMPRLIQGETRSQWRERTRAEIQAAQAVIAKEIGRTEKIFAYPFGEYDLELQQVVKDLGYLAFGQQSGPLGSQLNVQALPRFPFGGSFTDLDDFIMKVNTLPMPLTQVELYAGDSRAMTDLIIKQGERPYLVLTPADSALLGKINCYVTGQGAAQVKVVKDKVWVQAQQPLPQGRTRYNCTAASAERNRFYWYTQQWLASDAKGQWGYSD